MKRTGTIEKANTQKVQHHHVERTAAEKKGHAEAESSIFTLLICVLGIYVSFITWSVLQERINTSGYGPSGSVKFKAPLVVNSIQSIFACIVGAIYLAFKTSGDGDVAPLDVFKHKKIIKYFIIISITQSISSPVGLKSLEHVNYLIFLLAKSCKLIPVMMVQFLVFGKKFPPHKYAVALCITAGVSIFTIFKTSSSSSTTTTTTAMEKSSTSMIIGIGYLLISMFLDGLTNSTQDQLFKIQGIKLTGGHLMSGLNFWNSVLTISYAALMTNQISYAIVFFKEFPEAFYNTILFAIFGSIGQIFIFITLEKFDSIVLVTVTVTRKMFSMLLSVVIFGHVLSFMQWIGVSLVFGGIGLEAWLKNSPSSSATKAKKTN